MLLQLQVNSSSFSFHVFQFPFRIYHICNVQSGSSHPSSRYSVNLRISSSVFSNVARFGMTTADLDGKLLARPVLVLLSVFRHSIQGRASFQCLCSSEMSRSQMRCHRSQKMSQKSQQEKSSLSSHHMRRLQNVVKCEFQSSPEMLTL